MKKTIASLAIAVAALGFTACGSEDPELSVEPVVTGDCKQLDAINGDQQVPCPEGTAKGTCFLTNYDASYLGYDPEADRDKYKDFPSNVDYARGPFDCP